MARSPLNDRPPEKVEQPYYSRMSNKWIIRCPNGEKLEFSGRESAWTAFYNIKDEV